MTLIKKIDNSLNSNDFKLKNIKIQKMRPMKENKQLILTIHPKKIESRNENRNQ